MEIQIRQATIQDLNVLMQWRMEVLHEVFSIPLGAVCNRAGIGKIAALSNRTAAGRTYCLLCLRRGRKIVGCGGICLYHEMPSPDNLNGKCAYLMNIYTRPQFRGHGIGNRIVRWLVEQARQRHISKIYLETSDKGRPLYQTIGFADMKDMMKLSRENKQNQRSIHTMEPII